MSNNKLPKPMTPRQQAAMKRKREAEELQKIKEAAYQKGRRQAARYMAEREGFDAGVRSQMSKKR